MTFLPEADRDYLRSKEYQFEEIVDSNRNGLVIRDYCLPKEKFNIEIADLLILIPPCYPDVKPDMWYFYPAIFLTPSNRVIPQTEGTIHFGGREWQRWSRHFPASEWRAGIDGIHTYLKKIDSSLLNA